jgi:hypothetical protein
MTQPATQERRQPRSHRVTPENALPYPAAQLPPDLRSPTNVNAFIYSLTVEATAGRVDSRRPAILGYLS